METELQNAMSDGAKLFMPGGASWMERAALGELRAVISPTASDRGNDFHHAVHVFAARAAFRRQPNASTILDFGCGTGRFLRFFAKRDLKVVGTDITFDMLKEARRIGLPHNASTLQTDGVTLPFSDGSVDAIWCCGVLRYTLFASPEVYEQIAREMYRVLKPAGEVINVEMYVDLPPEHFKGAFERAGFDTADTRLLKRYDGLIENCLKSQRWPRAFVKTAGQTWGALHYWFANPHGKSSGFRDYLFRWVKP